MKRNILFSGLVVLALCAARWYTSADDKIAPGDDFVKRASAAGIAQMRFGLIAAQQAADPDVRRFGKRMIDDHGSANAVLKDLADRKAIQVAADMDEQHRALANKLEHIRGPEFDRVYLKAQVKDHEEMVALFEAQAQRGLDADFRAFAERMLPILRDQLEAARELRDKVK